MVTNPTHLRPAFGGLDSELRAAFGGSTEPTVSYKVKSHGATLESQLAAGYNSMADSLGGMINNSAGGVARSSPGQEMDKYKEMERFLSSSLAGREQQHRYQNSDSAGFHSQAVDVRPYGLALYNFLPQYENELGFSKGDMIFLLQHVDGDWLEGELDCQRGIFPKSYITIVVDCPTLFPELDVAVVTGSQYRVVFSFTGEREGDLSVREGDFVTILSQTDLHWCLVRDSHNQTGLCPLNHLNTCPQKSSTISSLDLEDISRDSSRDSSTPGHSLKFFDPLCSPDEEMMRLESELIRKAAERPRVPVNNQVRLHTNLNLGNIGGSEDQKRPSRHRFKSSLAARSEGKPNIDSFISQNLDGLKEIKAPIFLSTTANFVPSVPSTDSGPGKKSFTISDSIREELMDRQKKSAVTMPTVIPSESSIDRDNGEDLQGTTNNETVYLPMSDLREDKEVSSSTVCSPESVYATVNKKKCRATCDVFYHSVDVTSEVRTESNNER